MGKTSNASAVATVTWTKTPSKWDKRLEREFRNLALEETKGTLTNAGALRLEMLSLWRENLRCPLSSDEILLQIKHDRLLEKTEQLLKEYVEFQETAPKKGTVT